MRGEIEQCLSIVYVPIMSVSSQHEVPRVKVRVLDMVKNRASIGDASTVPIHLDEAVGEEGDQIECMEGEVVMEKLTLAQGFVLSEKGSKAGEVGPRSHGPWGRSFSPTKPPQICFFCSSYIIHESIQRDKNLVSCVIFS